MRRRQPIIIVLRSRERILFVFLVARLFPLLFFATNRLQILIILVVYCGRASSRNTNRRRWWHVIARWCLHIVVGIKTAALLHLLQRVHGRLHVLWVLIRLRRRKRVRLRHALAGIVVLVVVVEVVVIVVGRWRLHNIWWRHIHIHVHHGTAHHIHIHHRAAHHERIKRRWIEKRTAAELVHLVRIEWSEITAGAAVVSPTAVIVHAL
mmetsp:Transcript_52250/g.86481  ORF Transcript_52250/g.86481 Transcript_52250/m.86481 type:complete len:208 (+) Transcript_52250:486-1109(+)